MLLTPCKSITNLLQKLIWAGIWLFAISTLLALGLRWWPGERFFVVRLINYFMPWLLVGLIPGLFIAILLRHYRLTMILGLITIFVSFIFAPLFLPSSRIAFAANTDLKIMSYNVWGRNQNLEVAAQLIQEVQPDILLLQEVYAHNGYRLFKQLDGLYPDTEYYLVYEPEIGQAVISRYPLRQIEASRKKGRVQKVIVSLPEGSIEVWNVHPTAPLSWSRQYRQISALAEDIAQANHPLIVAGDFNTTDQAEAYHLINQHLKNAHWEAGWGFGFSFPAHAPRLRGVPIPTPMVRIDHIFYSHHFFARRAETLAEAGGSDHLPVVTELLLIK